MPRRPAETSRPHYNVIFAVLLIGISAYAVLQSLVAPVLATFITALHTTQDTATWLMTAYLLSASVATPILGRIGDKVGKERMLVLTLLALTLGSGLAALSHSVALMIIARAIQGLGGGLLPLSFGIIRDEFPPEKVNSAIGLGSATVAVGGGLGLLIAGPIVTHLNYHWLFWIPMVLTAIATVACWRFVPESPVRTPGKISWGAAVLLSAWLVMLLLAVSEGPTWGWGSTKVIGLFLGAVVCLPLWILTELKSSAPLIDMRMMRLPAVWTTNVVALLFGVGMYTVMTFLPQLVQTPRATAGYGLSASITQSGVYLLPMTIGMFLLGIAAAPLAKRIGLKAVLVLGCAVSIPGFAALAFGHSQGWEIYLACGLLGIGIGLAFASMSAIVVQSVPAAQVGVASGMNANIRTIGGAFGSSVAASVLATGVTAANPLPKDAGYTHVFWLLAAAAVLATLAALIIPAVKARSAPTIDELSVDDGAVPAAA
ncbi:major facilitator superfamily MFS_1 [Catenulispora acidiphila DSM 44928]|uniref:Major facilitator superfamily MFS_1 n=1 Tax=Catenulispora acidiphila (strain DSM 44928 / JCM 14897 / NBRC 102108 / NRRL B-24433 / ID139908) TaxID=479433 RepID=C7QGE6_CATAD|nr:MFS transporter [Catenulispora acidiphila]ACU72991.1 major facilitator superfamily MFS_1 [Catenulispora acidiphila DSM 44928]